MERRGVKMRVDLRALKPNPMRDFAIDPIDHEIIARLRQSIEEDGFWGGIACRMLPDGTVQIGSAMGADGIAISADGERLFARERRSVVVVIPPSARRPRLPGTRRAGRSSGWARGRR